MVEPLTMKRNVYNKRVIPDYDPQDILTRVNYGDCWEWEGVIDHYGYGVYGNKRHLAHRIVYKLLVNEPRADMCLDHLCRNRRCVNPEHLEEVTHKENVLRGKTITSRNLNKVVCKNGHPFNDENTYIHPARQTRDCRTCRSLAVLRYAERKKGNSIGCKLRNQI